MRQILLLAAWVILTSSASATTVSVSFDHDRLEFDCVDGRVEYDGFDLAGVGQALALPSRTCFVELREGETAASVSFLVTDSESLGQLSQRSLQDDIATGETTFSGDNAESLFVERGLGREVVEVGDEFESGHIRYLRLLLFPVTVQTDGSALFNRAVAITIGDRFLSAEQLLDQPLGVPGRSPASRPVSASDGADATEYVIIAARELAAPLERLASYKNSTGYNTEVRFIDEILASYAGRDDAERLRNYLLQFFLEGGSYVLMAGDHTVLPIRYAYHLTADTIPEVWAQQVCDLYFADLTGDWDRDNDNVWGEPTHDRADIIPELAVGRLPFSAIERFDAYVDKLIAYETAPGGDDPSYLSRAFFFCSDQMRDYSGGGQHGRIAEAYPAHMDIDSTNGVELERGDDPNPHNAPAKELESVLSDGYGIVNIIAHGTGTLFEVRTTEYNHYPKTRFTTDTTSTGNGVIGHLAPNDRVSLYYSLACDNGAFDYNYPEQAPNMVVTSLGLPHAGAVGFVANSRWGWVGSSHLLQKAFFDSAFAHPGRPAIQAMYDAKLRYHYVRDVVYGQNFYGDPTFIMYDDVPSDLAVEVFPDNGVWNVEVTAAGKPVADCLVVLSDSAGTVGRVYTNQQGHVGIEGSYEPLNSYTIAAVKPGFTIARRYYVPQIAADAEDRIDDNMPAGFGLSQNYPNPFNPLTTIRFDLPRRTAVDLSIYNILGQHVATLSEGVLPYGSYEVSWDGRDEGGAAVASGVYFYRLVADSYVDSKKLALIR